MTTTNERRAETEEKLKVGMEAQNQPFDLVGKVVDQDGNSMANVRISGRIRSWDGTTRSDRETPIEKETDIDGRFDIHDQSGDAFALEAMQKDGYELEPGRRTLGPVGGSASEPMLFRMWRSDIKEPLISGKQSISIIPDGREYTIDITNGVATEGTHGKGDLLLRVKRPERVALGQRFNWLCDLQVIQGGLLENENGQAMYLAPSDGYSNSFHFDAQNGWPDTTGNKHFFLKLKNGRYGRAAIEIMAFYNEHVPGMIRIDYALNPTGSRVLK